MSEALRAETISFEGHDGAAIEAYLAQPLDRTHTGGVVVLHHMPGLDEHTQEVTRRFAAEGYLAICPNLYSREAPGMSAQDAFGVIWKRGGVPDDQVAGDVASATDVLRSMPQSNARVGVIGYCSGGRQALYAACTTALDAAVDCYGAFVVDPPDPKLGLLATPIIERVGSLGCPLLGLFGADDTDPSTEEVAALAEALTAHHKTFEFHVHEGAGHAFFATNRPNYRVEAAGNGWRQVLDFFAVHLTQPVSQDVDVSPTM